jgi:hypothetical protein
MGKMRIAVWISAFALAAAAIPAAAGSQHSGGMELLEKATLNGKELPAGEYKVTWEGDGGDVKVTVLSGHNVMAEGRGRLEERKVTSDVNEAVTKRDGSGAMVITELHFAGKKEVLILSAS